MKKRIEIAGMSCGHCVARVRKALESLEGVTLESIDLHEALISPKENVTDEEICGRIEGAGYRVISIS